MNKIVTCVLPVYNHARWVKDAVQSIIDQSYKHRRIVLVDDASTDNSWEVICSLIDIRQNIQDVSTDEPKQIVGGFIQGVETIAARFHKNRGPAAARNYGIRTGWENAEFIAFLDSDDMFMPTKLEESVNILNADLAVSLVYSDYLTVDEAGREYYQYKEPFSRERLLMECIINCNSVLRKSSLQEDSLFDDSLRVTEDYDHWLRLTERGLAVHIASPLVKIRIGSHSSTVNVPKQVWEECYGKVINKTRQRM